MLNTKGQLEIVVLKLVPPLPTSALFKKWLEGVLLLYLQMWSSLCKHIIKICDDAQTSIKIFLNTLKITS